MQFHYNYVNLWKTIIPYYLFLLLIVRHSSFSMVLQSKNDCNLDITKLNQEPIITNETYNFLYPEPGEDSITLKKDEVIVVACPDGNLLIDSQTYKTVNAICVSDNNFQIENKTLSFKSIGCSAESSTTARYTGGSCELNGKQIEIGFVLTNHSFAQQIIICFDDIAQTPLYSLFKLTKSIGSRENNVPRPRFIEGDFYNIGNNTVNELYRFNRQRATINSLLGLPLSSTKYIVNSGDYYLSRGHLTAKADFVYNPQQRATFYYVNVAPQWQSFNGNNWQFAEEDVREYGETNGLDLLIYTGTYGITTLPHEETGEATKLFLYVSEDGRKGIPVPELYWKVVYDPEAKKGIALLGINNPYQMNITQSIICKDLSDNVTWLNWKKHDISQGYCYVCAIDDLRDAVQQIPSLDVSAGLLL